MYLRSGKVLKEMAQPTNNGTSASSQSSQYTSQAQSLLKSTPIVGVDVSTAMGETMVVPISIEMEVTTPATMSTSAAAMTLS